MKRIFLILFMIFPSISLAANRNPASSNWEKAFFGGAGTYPMIIADVEIQDRLYLASDVAGNLYSDDKGDNWEYMNIGITTIINANIAQSQTHPEIMYSLGRKLVKSTNRGRSWTAVINNENGGYTGTRPEVHKTIAISRTDPNVVYVGFDNGKIRKTINGGSTWTDYATPWGTNVEPTFVYLNPAGTYLFVGSLSNGIKKYDLATGTATTIILAGTNATRNWDYDTYQIGGTEYFCVTAGHKIACTSDNGDNWTYTNATTADATFLVSRIAARYLSSTEVKFIAYVRLVANPYGTTYTYLSDDSGDTWTDVQNNVTVNTTDNPSQVWASYGTLGNIVSLESDPFDEDVWYATTDWTIWRSDDGGENWVEKVHGAQNTVISDIIRSPNGILFACGMDIGVYKSIDNGDTWTAILPDAANSGVAYATDGIPDADVAGFYWRLLALGSEEDWNSGNGILLATNAWWSDPKPRVARSVNNGDDWTFITSGLPTTILNASTGASDPHRANWGIGYARAIAKASDDSVVYLGIDGYSATENGGIFKSTNEGLTWTRTTQPPNWKVYNGLTVDPTNATGDTVTFATWFGSAEIYKSTNGGTSWTTVTPSPNIFSGNYDLTYNSTGNLFWVGLFSDARVGYSTNGDAGTWAVMKDISSGGQVADGLFVDPNDPNRLFVGVNDGTNTGPAVTGAGGGNSSASGAGGGSVYVTNNATAYANATWANISGDLPSPSGITAITINPDAGEEGYLFAGTDGTGVFRLNLSDTVPTTLQNVDIGE